MNTPVSHTTLPSKGRIDRGVRWFAQHWLAWYVMLTCIWVLLPWLAPVLMQHGSPTAAWLIYQFYSPQCHQLPQRSYFLFGDRLMPSLNDILAVTGPHDPLTLRSFIGTPQLGWKVAWSDRMVSLYTPLFVGAVLYALVRRRWAPLPLRRALLLPYLPLLLDGLSHMLDDTFRLGLRSDNAWLAVLTGHLFAPGFYSSDIIGSFNWWARLLTGLLAGFAFVRQVYPLLDREFAKMAYTPPPG